jgi:hypothetical protein
MVPFILKSNSVSLFPAGQAPILIDSEHVNFAAVVEAIRSGDFDAAVELASVTNFLKTISGGAVSVSEQGVTYKGELLTGYLANKMVVFFNQGLPVEHYCTFLSNLMANPSMTARKELYNFLEAADLPITEDGCFLAYKAVRSDFKDIHSAKFDNSPGKRHVMARAEVDDDRTRTCSYGFHAAAYQYARNFMQAGGKMVAVKINPADVVSIPADYNNQKLRCCDYTVMFEVPGAADIFKDRAFMSSNAGAVGAAPQESFFWDSSDDDLDF